MANNTQISQILRRLREERKISQKNVAMHLGISQALLSHYEKGIRECGLDFLVRAAKYYGVTTDYLLGVKDNNIKNIREGSGISPNAAESAGIDTDATENVNIDNKESTYTAYPILYKNLLVKLINYIFGGFESVSSSAPEYKALIKTSGEYVLLSVFALYKYLFDSGECISPSSFEKIFSAQLKAADNLKLSVKQGKLLYERDLLAANDYIRFMIKNCEKIISR